MGKTAREIMTADCTCVGESDSVLDAAKRLAELNVGSLPICGDDNRLVGIVAQADIARNYDEEKVGDLVEAISR